MTDDLRFSILGSLTVEFGEAPVPLPRSTVLRGLLGVLLLAEGEPLSPVRLTDLVWSDRAEVTSKKSVHVGISRLRRWLNAVTSRGAQGVAIEHGSGGYSLAVPPPAVDLGRFRELAGTASASADEVERRRLFASALDLRRGPVLACLTGLDRADTLPRSIEESVRGAAMSLAEAALKSDDPASAIPALNALVEEHLFDEPLHATLIELLVADGRQADALRCFHRLRERLVEELGVEPSALVRQAFLGLLAGDHPPPVSQGSRPEPPAYRGSLAETSRPAQLPADIHDFTGRELHVASLIAGLGPEEDEDGSRAVRIGLVTGLSGIGKTALAVHAAHQLAESFPDGQFYADLKGAMERPAEPTDILCGFLRALGVSGAAIPRSEEEQAALYRSRLAGRRVLVLLDNAASERQVRPLIPGGPDQSVLVTSRVPLAGIEAAVLVRLDVLEAPEARGLLLRIIGPERVDAESGPAAEILELCDFIPLAIRIAGARLRSRPDWRLARLAALLRDKRRRLGELEVGDLAARVGLELSYARLPADVRRAFRYAGLLEVPHFARWALAALLDVSPVAAEAHIEALIDAHFITRAAGPNDEEPRYRMHDLVRLVAWERSQAEDPEAERVAAVGRAIGAWLGLSEAAAEMVPGPVYAVMHGPASRWHLPPSTAAELLRDPMRWYDAERAALFAAVRQATEMSLHGLAWDLAASMERYCDMRALYPEWYDMHDHAIEGCRVSGDRMGEAVLLRGLLEVMTWMSSEQLPGVTMVDLQQRARDLHQMFADLDQPGGRADALILGAWSHIAQGDPSGGLTAARQALDLALSVRYKGGQARAHHVMAIAHGEREIEEAIACLKQALQLAEEIGNPRFQATALQFLGAAYDRAGATEKGRVLLSRSLDIARELQDQYLETFSVLYLGKLLADLGDPGAKAMAERSMSLGRRLCLSHHLADSLTLLGELHLSDGNPAQAVDCLVEAVDLWRAHGWHTFRVTALRALGHAYARSGDDKGAGAAWHEAHQLLLKLGDTAAADELLRLLDTVAAGDRPLTAGPRVRVLPD